jgi:hypothetical protein
MRHENYSTVDSEGKPKKDEKKKTSGRIQNGHLLDTNHISDQMMMI